MDQLTLLNASTHTHTHTHTHAHAHAHTDAHTRTHKQSQNQTKKPNQQQQQTISFQCELSWTYPCLQISEVHVATKVHTEIPVLKYTSFSFTEYAYAD